MPSALVMVLAAYRVDLVPSGTGAGAVHGLELVAVAVAVQAVWGMAGNTCADRMRATIAVLATFTLLLLPSTVTQRRSARSLSPARSRGHRTGSRTTVGLHGATSPS